MFQPAEQQQQQARRLRGALEAADELYQISDLEHLYRRAVELTREKLDIERCGLFITAEDGETMLGTYGTDSRGKTTDEHSSSQRVADYAVVLTAPREKLWVAHDSPLTYWDEGERHTIGTGWVVGTVLRSAAGPIGILFNDNGLTGKPLDATQQDILGLYCSILANIIERRRAEEASKENEKRLRILIDGLPDQIFFKDIEGRLILNNLADRQALGATSLEEVVGKSDYDFYPKDWADHYYADDMNVIQSGQPLINREELARDEQGLTRWVLTTKIPLTDALGKPLGLVGIARDITARKQAEQALQDSRQFLQLVLDNIPQFVFWKDRDLNYLGCNRNFAQSAGLKEPEQIVGKSDYDLPWKTEETEAYHSDDRAVIDNGSPKYHIIEPRLQADGKQAWLDTTKVPLRNAAGDIVGMLGMFEDITNRIHMEQQVREALENERIASERLRAVVDAAYELIRTSDLSTVYRHVIELAREKLGVERCGLFILDEAGEHLQGTYGTDDRGQTINEHAGILLANAEREHDLLFAPRERLWTKFYKERLHWKDDQKHSLDYGWNVATVIQGSAGPLGILYNDAAITNKPYDEALQETLAIYCSIVGSILDNKRLEQRIRESLGRRGQQVQISTEVSQEIAAVSQLDEIFHRVVTLIKERFNYYHVQLFRYDPAQDTVVLVIGYGEVGQKMMAAGHHLPMGHGVVGTAAATGKAILATDVRQDADWHPNPNLPDTQGELAVPIKWRDHVLGILDVQSDHADKLTEDDRLLLEGLCGQIATAIESTRLLEELRASQSQLAEALRIAHIANWEYDVASDTFTFNDQFYSLLHTTAEHEGGYTMSSAQYTQRFVHPEDAPLVGREVQLALETTDPNFSRQLDHRIYYGDGKPGYMTVRFRVRKDAQGRTVKTFGANQDITERKQAEQQMEETLHEMERVYATVSRESWQAYRQLGQVPKGYLFDRSMVQSADTVWEPEVEQAVREQSLVTTETNERAMAVTPLSVRGEIVGALGVYDDPDAPLSPEDLALIEATSEQVALALESARLFEQTEVALSETEQLYNIGVRINTATTLDDLLRAAITPGIAADASSAGLWLFDLNEAGQPTSMQFTASWTREGASPMSLGTRLRVADFSSSELWLNTGGRSSFINDIDFDSRVDPAMRLAFQQLQIAATGFMPLVTSDRWVGIIIVSWRQPHEFTPGEQRMYQSIASQVAVAIENRRLFEQTQRAARREQILREVTTRVRSSNDPEVILRTLAGEIGTLLGRRTIVQLEQAEALTATPQGEGHAELNRAAS